MTTITIHFDMDGTIADLYGIDNWLEMLIASNTYPYENAKPLLRLSALAKRLNNLQAQGYQIGIISWLSKSGTDEYNERVAQVKREWLAKHLPSVNWDSINIVPYGTPKSNFATTPCDILFDDEERNRKEWTGRAFDVDNILGVLATLGTFEDKIHNLYLMHHIGG